MELIKYQSREAKTSRTPGLDRFAWAALREYDLLDDIDKGLGYIKKTAKHRYRVAVKKHHPDTKRNKMGKGRQIAKYQRMLKHIMNLETMPLTVENMETALELRKGYTDASECIDQWDDYYEPYNIYARMKKNGTIFI